MRDVTGLVGRETLVEKVVQEVRKGRHIVLTGPIGVGKSAVLEAVLSAWSGDAANALRSMPNPTTRRASRTPSRTPAGPASASAAVKR